MDLEQAKKIAGNQPSYALKNMHKALSMCRWLNTSEEEERLQATCIILTKPYPKYNLK